MLDKIIATVKKKKRRIGIGIIKKDEEVIKSLNKAKKYVEVVVYDIKSFKSIN